MNILFLVRTLLEAMEMQKSMIDFYYRILGTGI